MPDWRITRLRGGFALTFEQDGKRRRFAIQADNAIEAKQRAPAVYAEVTRPVGRNVQALWEAYRIEKAGRSIVTTMGYTWKALSPFFANRDGEAISQDECQAYSAHRRKQGRSNGAIHTELGHLRTVLVWAVKKRLISHAPEIARPAKPAPKNRHLTKREVARILAAAPLPHVKLVIHLMLATAARISAILELTWDRVDMDRGVVHLTDTEDGAPRKGRATVPINKTLRRALTEARRAAFSDYVIEWGGERVKSVKKAIESAARRANVADVSPHVFRHTAAVWMAEAGISMAEIAQYLGHSNQMITYKVYARYSPTHLRKAAESLEIDEYEVLSVTHEPDDKNEE